MLVDESGFLLGVVFTEEGSDQRARHLGRQRYRQRGPLLHRVCEKVPSPHQGASLPLQG